MSPIIDIDLLRHGETEGDARYCGSTDISLAAAGWDQMWAVVGNDARWETIVSSPLKRCAQFAEALAQRHRLALRIDDRLRELHFGNWEGRSAAEIMQTDAEDLTRFWRNPSQHAPPGGESLTMLQTRVLSAWQDILAECRTALVVTHGGPIRIILCHLHGTSIDDSLRIDIPHASLWRTRKPT
ncbi:MAG TPA: alpha-ribazole phosphatase [Burkholderiales bacterium]|nr:alpha-ribazole phosphatase [Burkholderiales bacterium]